MIDNWKYFNIHVKTVVYKEPTLVDFIKGPPIE